MGFPRHPDRRPVVVTGASSGIGAATARLLAGRGYPVALGARRTERLADLVAEIRDAGGEAIAQPLDVTSDDSVALFADKVIAELGDVEIVVSNAGVTAPGTVHEISSERFSSELDLNLVGAHRIVRAFVPAMVERRRGDLVLISSDVAVRARPFMAAYAAGKWGLEGMAAAMQMELEGTGVRVSLVRPGPTAFPGAAAQLHHALQVRHHLMGLRGDPIRQCVRGGVQRHLAGHVEDAVVRGRMAVGSDRLGDALRRAKGEVADRHRTPVKSCLETVAWTPCRWSTTWVTTKSHATLIRE